MISYDINILKDNNSSSNDLYKLKRALENRLTTYTIKDIWTLRDEAEHEQIYNDYKSYLRCAESLNEYGIIKAMKKFRMKVKENNENNNNPIA